MTEKPGRLRTFRLLHAFSRSPFQVVILSALGGTGLVRLHPLWREAWTKVQPGAEIAMHEGGRVVGNAVMLRVTLRGRP